MQIDYGMAYKRLSKSVRGRKNITDREGKQLPTISQLAKKCGKNTGQSFTNSFNRGSINIFSINIIIQTYAGNAPISMAHILYGETEDLITEDCIDIKDVNKRLADKLNTKYEVTEKTTLKQLVKIQKEANIPLSLLWILFGDELHQKNLENARLQELLQKHVNEIQELDQKHVNEIQELDQKHVNEMRELTQQIPTESLVLEGLASWFRNVILSLINACTWKELILTTFEGQLTDDFSLIDVLQTPIKVNKDKLLFILVLIFFGVPFFNSTLMFVTDLFHIVSGTYIRFSIILVYSMFAMIGLNFIAGVSSAGIVGLFGGIAMHIAYAQTLSGFNLDVLPSPAYGSSYNTLELISSMIVAGCMGYAVYAKQSQSLYNSNKKEDSRSFMDTLTTLAVCGILLIVYLLFHSTILILPILGYGIGVILIMLLLHYQGMAWIKKVRKNPKLLPAITILILIGLGFSQFIHAPILVNQPDSYSKSLVTGLAHGTLISGFISAFVLIVVPRLTRFSLGFILLLFSAGLVISFVIPQDIILGLSISSFGFFSIVSMQIHKWSLSPIDKDLI